MPTVIIGSQYADTVVPLIEAACSSIEIIIFRMSLKDTSKSRPVDRLISALCAATFRGVSVRFLVSSSGLAHRLRSLGFEARVLHKHKCVHAKMLLIDRRTVVLGSHNYTQSGFLYNLEISIVVTDIPSCEQLSMYFLRLWGV